MGHYTAHGVYLPDIFEVGWGQALNDDLALLEEELAGGGSGAGIGWVNAASAPYNAIGDGSADDTLALMAATEAAITAGALLYVPKGFYRWTAELANLVAGGFGLLGDGPGITNFLVGADLGNDGFYSLLSRHGVPNNDRAGPLPFARFSLLNPDRVYTGHGFNGMWQGIDLSWEDIYMEGLVGCGIGMVACRRFSLKNVTLVNCGRGDAGFASISVEPSLEGGVTAGVCEDGIMENVKVIGSDDHGVRWMQVSRGKMIGCTIDGSGAARSAFYGLDLDGCVLMGNNVDNGADDNIHLQSSGASKDNVIVGNVCRGALGGTPGTGFGINEYAANAEQIHTDNVIEHNVMTGNSAGGVHRA